MNSLLAANLSCLQQGIAFLRKLPRELYSRKCPDIFGSTIGGHFRHNLDHYLAFVAGFSKGRVDYDARDRSPDVEADPAVACSVMRELIQRLQALDTIAHELELTICMDDGGQSAWTRTTLARELQFLLSHTIHHYALVVAIATRYGYSEFPEGFGVAPSTIHYRETQTT